MAEFSFADIPAEDADVAPPAEDVAPPSPAAAPAGGAKSFSFADIPADEDYAALIRATPETPMASSGDRWQFARGVMTGIGTTPDAIGGAARMFNDLAGGDPGNVLGRASTALREHAKGWSEGDNKLRVPNFTDIGGVGDAIDYVLGAAGNTVGSSLGPIAGTAIGGALGSTIPVVGTVAGATAGFAGSNFLIGWGTINNAMHDDAGVKAALANGQLTNQQVAAYSVVPGIIVGGLEMYSFNQLAKLTGLTKKATEEVIKRSVLQAVLHGAKTEGWTETSQQVVQEIATGLAGGNVDLQNRLTSILNNGVAGVVGGAALGGAGGLAGKLTGPRPIKNDGNKADTDQQAAIAAAAPTTTPAAGVDQQPPPPVAGSLAEAGEPTPAPAPEQETAVPVDDEDADVSHETPPDLAAALRDDTPTAGQSTPGGVGQEAPQPVGSLPSPAETPQPAAVPVAPVMGDDPAIAAALAARPSQAPQQVAPPPIEPPQPVPTPQVAAPAPQPVPAPPQAVPAPAPAPVQTIEPPPAVVPPAPGGPAPVMEPAPTTVSATPPSSAVNPFDDVAPMPMETAIAAVTPTGPMLSRAQAEARRILLEATSSMAHREADLEPNARPFVAEASEQAVREFEPELQQMTGAPAPMVRGLQERVDARAREIIAERVAPPTEDTKLAEAQQIAAAREVERSGSEKTKSVTGIAKESERSHLRAARKQVEEKGEDAPGWAKKTLEVAKRRSELGAGQGTAKKKAERAGLSERMAEARQERAQSELERGAPETRQVAVVQAQDDATRKRDEDEVRAKAAFDVGMLPAATTGTSVDRRVKFTPPNADSVYARGRLIVSAAKALGVTIPTKLSRDNTPFMNGLVMARMAAERKLLRHDDGSGRMTVDDFAINEALIRAGEHQTMLDMALGAGPVVDPNLRASTMEEVDHALQLASRDPNDRTSAEMEREERLSTLLLSSDEMAAPRGWDSIDTMVETRKTNFKRRSYTGAEALGLAVQDVLEASGSLPGGKISQVIGRMVRKNLVHLVGDTPVRFISRADMAASGHPTALGLYSSHDIEGMAQGYTNKITIVDDLLSGSPDRLLHVLQHELTHAATITAYHANLNNARATWDRLAKYAREAVGERDDFGQSWYAFGAVNKDGEYRRTSVTEFIAEVFSNPAFQEALRNAAVPANMRAQFRALAMGRTEATMWDVIVARLQSLLNMSGFGAPATNFLSEALRAAPDVFVSTTDQQSFARDAMARQRAEPFAGMVSEADPFGVYPMLAPVEKAFHAARIRADYSGLRSKGRRALFWAKTAGQQMRESRDVFGGVGNVMEKLWELHLKGGPISRRLMRAGDDLTLKLHRYAKNNPLTAEAVSTIAHDSTLGSIDPTEDIGHANNSHIAKTGAEWAQARGMHERNRKAFLALPKEAQQLLVELRDFYKDVQDKMMTLTVGEILHAANDKQAYTLPPGETVDTVRDWVLGKGLTRGEAKQDARDKALLAAMGGLGRQLKDAVGMKLVKGFYTPLMRRGDYVVSAESRVEAPPGGVVVGNQIVFKDQKIAEAWLKTRDGDASAKYVWVDPATGQIVKKNDLDNSVRRVIVTMQNRHVRFFENLTEGEEWAKELRASDAYDKVEDAKPRTDLPRHGMELMPQQVNSLIKSIEARTDLDQNIRELTRKLIIEDAFRSMAGTRVQHRRLARRGVLGFSKDLVLSLRDYNTSTANYIGRMTFSRPIRNQREKVVDYIAINNYSGDQRASQRRQEQLDSFDTTTKNVDDYFQNNWVSRFTTLSFLSYLASPAASLVNSTQVGMVTLPYLSSKFGLGASAWEIGAAYRAIGGARSVGEGLMDTARAVPELWRGPRPGAADAVGPVAQRVATQKDGAALQAMLARVHDLGLIAEGAGTEIEKTEIGRGKVDMVLGRLAHIARALPEHIEAINRSVTAVATYRLAIKHKQSVEQATQAAIDAVEATQGDYSSRGTARIFKNPTARVVLQFKKYPQLMGHLIARNVMQSFQGADKQTRREAAKTLLALGLATTAMAGASGLPWEIGKMLVMAAWLLGLSHDWETLEAGVYAKMKQIMSDAPAEAVMYGLPRLLGVNVSNRVGLDSMFFFGAPKEAKATDVKAWLFDTMAGAPGGAVSDGLKAIAAGFQGEGFDAAKTLPFPKVIKDTVKAIQGYTEGKVSKTGKPLAKPLTLPEAMVKSFGLQPASEARQFEAGGSGRKSKDDKIMRDKKSALTNDWVSAKPGPARDKAWARIKDWNAGQDADDRLTMSALHRSQQRRQRTNREAARELAD